MMERLYQALLHLLPRDFREQFGGEMLDVFRQASNEARSKGSAAYLVFSMREIAGLMMESLVHRTQIPRRILLIPAWGLSGFLMGLLVMLLMGPSTYTSVAILRVTRGGVPERVAPGAAALADVNLQPLITGALTRQALTNSINTHGLYLPQRSRLPMETIVEEMKRDIRMMPDDDGRGVMISFRYPEPELAQKVSQSITSRLMNEFRRRQTDRAELTERFLKEQVEVAATEWQRESERLQRSNGPSRDRVALDVELARKQYITLKEKLEETLLGNKLLKSMQGDMMELAEPASLPSMPDRSREMPVLAGTLGGLAMGVLLAWLGPLRFRRRPVVDLPVR